jgi:hypothetical protein
MKPDVILAKLRDGELTPERAGELCELRGNP